MYDFPVLIGYATTESTHIRLGDDKKIIEEIKISSNKIDKGLKEFRVHKNPQWAH